MSYVRAVRAQGDVFNFLPCVTVGPFANITSPAPHLPSIQRAPPSDPDVIISRCKPLRRVSAIRKEACLILGVHRLSNQAAHWVNAVRRDRARKVCIEKLLTHMGVCKPDFSLDAKSNLSMLDASIHKQLDVYATIAVTCTKETLLAMIELVDKANNVLQCAYTATKWILPRKINFEEECIKNAKYELVVLHPNLFLQDFDQIPFEDTDAQVLKHFVYSTSGERGLREFPADMSSAPFPSLKAPSRPTADRLNPFLVVINADIKFRRHDKEPEIYPDGRKQEDLPASVRELMALTRKLAALLGWSPVDPWRRKPGETLEISSLIKIIEEEQNISESEDVMQE